MTLMSWDRVRGHAAALASFRAATAAGRLGQSYLFVGPDGIGKRLFARELAKALLCDRPPAALAACDCCPACAQVEAGTHPDLFAVRRREDKNDLLIDDMRIFCGQMAMKPTRGTRKVGVVEDADDLNANSANAFLKTLEEPPAGSLVILLATDLDRQLPTILSRCQVVRFAALGPADLRAVLSGQGVTDAARLDRLVRLGGGSAAQALALNDEEFWDVRRKLIDGLTAPRPDFRGLAETWEQFYTDAGKDSAAQRLRISLVLRFLIEALQHALRLSLGATAADLEPAEADRLRAFADRLGTDRLLELIDECVEADFHVERKVQLILIVESVLERFTRPAASFRVAPP